MCVTPQVSPHSLQDFSTALTLPQAHLAGSAPRLRDELPDPHDVLRHGGILVPAVLQAAQLLQQQRDGALQAGHWGRRGARGLEG